MLDPVTIDSSDECSEDEKPVVLTVDEKLSVQKMKRDEVLHDLQNLKKIDLSSAPDRGIKIKSRIALLKYRLTIPFDDEADAISKPQIPKADMEKYMSMFHFFTTKLLFCELLFRWRKAYIWR